MFALGGAVGQAVGLVLSKYGMGDYHAFAATQIRIIAGMIGFAIIIIVLRKGSLIRNAFKEKKHKKPKVRTEKILEEISNELEQQKIILGKSHIPSLSTLARIGYSKKEK